ncbi:MAG TPA: FAD-dependent oxidoreductase [Jatrophihabitans sp.]|jgi:D-arginine dehydrogenase|uniref:NAD(P)/FAD-dependent oxidoreductase n=1 Tax=Jatrophihabitans sp. TaxID=1932789 RepID=UPI002E0009B4|nr:FAD-dependent oxidoreductase [Jatrophihabitans sp.]
MSYDVLVIGGGMAGVSIGYELAADRRVGLLEMEATLAFHTTGRSAAMFLESYGGAPIRALTTASRAFLENPPDDVESALLTPRAMLHIAAAGRGEQLRQLHRDVLPLVPDVRLFEGDDVRALQPLLRPGHVEVGLLEPGAMEVDVHALHQGYVRGLRRRGGEIAASAGMVSAQRTAGVWTVTDRAGGTWQAPVVVDAAGAWADEVAMLFGARPVGLRPLRRTAFMIDGVAGGDDGPMIADIDDTFYIKPEGHQYLCSPSDETPQPPSDARPDELEIARALDAIAEATTLDVRHVRSAWAGLRSFVADRTPVVGPDTVDGFFWCAAQGGYGIQTAPALARTAASLLRGEPVPDDVARRGLAAADLAPGRPGLR